MITITANSQLNQTALGLAHWSLNPSVFPRVRASATTTTTAAAAAATSTTITPANGDNPRSWMLANNCLDGAGSEEVLLVPPGLVDCGAVEGAPEILENIQIFG